MNKSENITDLVKSLINLQSELQPAVKDKSNPFLKSKYADLAGIADASRNLLKTNKLSLIQVCDIDASGPYLETILAHESGQWISGRYPLQAVKQNDPQALGSAMTYARRYTWAAILGIVTEDDDAEGAMDRKTESKQSEPSSKQKNNEKTTQSTTTQQATISDDWIKSALSKLKWNPLNWIKDNFGITGDKVLDTIKLMDAEQRSKFICEIKARLGVK
jgi:hypothetical protein